MPTFRQDTKIGGMVPMMKTDDYNDQSVTEEKLKDGAITTRKIADGSVTKDKLDSSIRQEINDSVTASNEATEKAKEATAKADQATAAATAAKEAADTATQAATTATTASVQATEQAKAATTKAEEATAKANEAAQKADDSREQTEQTLGTMQGVISNITKEQKRVGIELEKKFDKESVVQESGEAEDKVMSQKVVSDKLSDLSSSTNKNVFSANAEINAFIKECYIENWSGEDLFFVTVNTNDGGANQVSIFIEDSENNSIISIYKEPLQDIYFNTKNGVKAYFTVDTKVSINYNAKGLKTDRNKISSRAFSLINSPMIKEKYFTDFTTENTNAAGDVTSTKLSWKNFIYYKMSNRTNLLTSWKNELFCKLEQFIVSLKVSYKYIDDKEKVEKYLSHLYLINFHLAEDGLWFNLNNQNELLDPSSQWILYNIHFCDKKEEGIQSYAVTFYDYTITVTVNWNYYFEETDPAAFDISGKLEIINYLDTTATSISVEESINNINKELAKKLNKENIVHELGYSEEFIPSQKCITESFDKINSSIVNIENVLPNLCNSDNALANESFSKFEISNGKLNIVASGNTDTSMATRRDFNIPLKAGHKYNLAYKILFKDKVLLYNADLFNIVFWAYRDNEEKNDAYVSILMQPGDIKPTTQEWVNVNASFEAKANGNITTIELQKYNNTKTTDKILDVEISYIMLLDSTELGLDNYQLREILLQKDSFFTDIQIFKYYPIHQLYYNMKLRSLGDSLPETVAFQPWIANELGMKYSTEFEHNTKQIEYNGQSVTSYRSTWGGTRVAPVITSSTDERYMANGSIYMRAKSLKYDMPDVLIILAGYNDIIAGSPYIDGGTYVQPADYGINDAPYIGDAIDLVSDKTQTAPSFGASYRGMLEQIIKDNPRCRIILCGVPRGSGEANKFGKEDDWNEAKNKVIEKIAKEYGYPFVNLADLYGVNKFNYEYLTKDNLHFSDFGGRRVAMEILAKAF